MRVGGEMQWHRSSSQLGPSSGWLSLEPASWAQLLCPATCVGPAQPSNQKAVWFLVPSLRVVSRRFGRYRLLAQKGGREGCKASECCSRVPCPCPATCDVRRASMPARRDVPRHAAQLGSLEGSPSRVVLASAGPGLASPPGSEAPGSAYRPIL